MKRVVRCANDSSVKSNWKDELVTKRACINALCRNIRTLKNLDNLPYQNVIEDIVKRIKSIEE